MDKQMFKGFSESTGLSKEEISLHSLLENPKSYQYERYLQFLGFQDDNEVNVYEGDVLELKITEQLMDHEASLFYNSNLGRVIEQEGDITSVVIVMAADDKTCMTSKYEVYFCRNGEIESTWVTYGEEPRFPKYLAEKGAIIVGNIIENEKIFDLWRPSKEV